MSEENPFRDAMADVAPLTHKPKVSVERPPKAPSAQQVEARRAALGEKPASLPGHFALSEVPQVAPRDHLEWRKNGVQELVVEGLRRGKYQPTESLDLHGERVKSAALMVHKFLQRMHDREARCVLISHGRGEKSATPAKLKSFVAAWLQAHPLVNAFTSAPRQLGGTGSVLVLLRKSASARETTRQMHGGKGEPE